MIGGNRLSRIAFLIEGPQWVLHRLFANYWLLAVCATVVAFPVALGLLALDRAGATAWLLANDLSPVASADTAKDFLGVSAGVNAAFITLYFSITLIVLSMAAGNLGVRLIDRWLERTLVRVSLAGLSFSLVVTLIAMLAVDHEGPLSQVPLLLLTCVLLLQSVNVAMLSVSLHGLGRTMFVDTSIDRLGRDACARSVSLKGIPKSDGQARNVLAAPREGYIENVDIEKLRSHFEDSDCRVTVLGAPGQHVLEGQPILRADCSFDKDAVARHIPIGRYRSDSQGVVFRIRLLVEIAARALSPAINDFYTALACADKLASVIESQTNTWIEDGEVAVHADAQWLELPGRDFHGLFRDPLSAFRQAACEYPSVAIRMIGNYDRIATRLEDDGAPASFTVFIRTLACELGEHTVAVSEYEQDREDVREAMRDCEAMWNKRDSERDSE